MKRIMVVLSLCMTLLMFSQAFSTNGTYLNGFSPLTVGRGGLSYGFFDSPSLMMNNPAALAFMPRSMMEANFSVLMPKLHFQNALNDKDGNSQTFPLFNLSYVHQSQNSSWLWGVGVFTQGGMGADFKLKHALFAEEQEYHSQFGVLEVGPSVVYRGGDDISVGASVHLLYGTMEMWMPFSLNPMMMTGLAAPGVTFGQMFAAPPASGGLGYNEVTAFAEMKSMAGFGVNANISAQYRVNDKLTIGAGFTSQSTLKLRNGSAMMDMTEQFNDAFNRMVYGALMQMGIDPGAATPDQIALAQQAVAQQLGQMGIDLQAGMVANYTVETDLKMPAKMGIGFSYRPSSRFVFGADLEYVFWSVAFDKMPLKMTGGTNSNINAMMGSSDIAIDFPLRWEDTYVIKIGAEFKMSEALTGRLGLVHGKNPVPSETLFPVFPAIVEHHVTAGLSWYLSPRLGLHFAYELALNKSQTVDKSIIASEYDGSTSELMEHLFYLSLTVGF